jgi:hypothetical protein
MNSIAKAINNVALSLSRIATALETKSYIQPTTNPILKKNTDDYGKYVVATQTSNPIPVNSTAKIKLTTNASSLTVSEREKEALDLVYKALINKTQDLSDYSTLVLELRNKWPDLWAGLEKLTTARSAPYRHTHDSPANQNDNFNIWKK